MDNMTPTSEVIRLAREADCLYVNLTVDPTLDAERLGRLISLAKAEEREACAVLCRSEVPHTETLAELRRYTVGDLSAAAPQPEARPQHQDASCDRHYIAGMKAGWNFALTGDEDGFQKSVEGRLREIQESKPEAQPTEAAQPIDLGVIREWPDGFEARLQHVWKDVISFIPNVKLWDLQRMLAEFGFTMTVTEQKGGE